MAADSMRGDVSRRGIAVVPARPDDLRALADIERECFSDPWSLAGFQSALATFGSCLRIARDGPSPDAAIRGYVAGWFVAGEGQIASLAVHPSFRRAGIASALLDEFLAEAARHDTVEIYLEVRESNVAARRLYAGRGFTEVSRRREYYRAPVEDGVVMRLRLDDTQ